jgi:hypothetical protein
LIVASPDPDDVARDAWRWYRQAESTYRKSKDGSPEEIQAIQAMSLAALAALSAGEAANKR